MSLYIQYYDDQVGGGVRNVFSGSTYHRGRGVRAWPGGLFRKMLLLKLRDAWIKRNKGCVMLQGNNVYYLTVFTKTRRSGHRVPTRARAEFHLSRVRDATLATLHCTVSLN